MNELENVTAERWIKIRDSFDPCPIGEGYSGTPEGNAARKVAYDYCDSMARLAGLLEQVENDKAALRDTASQRVTNLATTLRWMFDKSERNDPLTDDERSAVRATIIAAENPDA